MRVEDIKTALGGGVFVCKDDYLAILKKSVKRLLPDDWIYIDARLLKRTNTLRTTFQFSDRFDQQPLNKILDALEPLCCFAIERVYDPIHRPER